MSNKRCRVDTTSPHAMKFNDGMCMLTCPLGCSINKLQQHEVIVTQYDSASFLVTSTDFERMNIDELTHASGHKDSLYVTFYCECMANKDSRLALEIQQHNGNTYLKWIH